MVINEPMSSSYWNVNHQRAWTVTVQSRWVKYFFESPLNLCLSVTGMSVTIKIKLGLYLCSQDGSRYYFESRSSGDIALSINVQYNTIGIA